MERNATKKWFRSPNKSPSGYSFFQQLKALFSAPAVVIYLTFLSERNRLKSFGTPDKSFWTNPYQDQKVVLIALFQKGQLRPDIERLLSAAKDAGHYVIATNTLQLSNPDKYRELIDCYTERYNFGRDFGSYRQAFLHLFKSDMHKTCPRLLMLNDSVFFAADRTPKFLADMLGSDIEVLGSTENYEIAYHLGSFCIAFDGSILRHQKFQKYWRKYRQSDVRPKVIKRGEMGLSKALLKCASDTSQVRALYDSWRYAKVVNEADSDMLDQIIELTRHSDLTPAKRFLLRDQIDVILQEYTHDIVSDTDVTLEGKLDDVIQRKMYLGSYDDLKSVFDSQLVAPVKNRQNSLRDIINSQLIDNFRQHSQIHQNAALLLKMGLPIVKLDGVYRGIFDMLDVMKIARQLSSQEQEELELMLLSRPFGGDVLVGWKRSAFMRGLL